MRVRAFLFLIGLGAIISWISWFIVISYINLRQAGFVGFTVFYLSLFLALVGVIFLVGNWLRAALLKKQIIYNRLNTSTRL